MIDTPNINDAKYGWVKLSKGKAKKKKFDIGCDVIYDQNVILKGQNSCTICSMCGCINTLEQFDELSTNVYPVDMWNKALSIGASIKKGWTVQGSLALAKKEGHIVGYSIINTIDEIKKAIESGSPVATSSNCIKFSDINQLSRFYGKKGSSNNLGHARYIKGYDDGEGCFICRNSSGHSRGDKGDFYIKYEDINICLTKYAIIGKFSKFKDKFNKLKAL